MPGYSERARRVEFPELGEDIWVDVRNPLLLPLEPDEWAGLPARARALARCQRWISAWSVPDPDTDQSLASPPTAADMEKVPVAILDKVAEVATKWSNPLPPTTEPSTTGSPSNSPSSSPTAPTPEMATTSPPS